MFSRSQFIATLFAASTCLAIVVASYAESARELKWEDLLPPTLSAVEDEARGLLESVLALPADEREQYNAVEFELWLRDGLTSGLRKDSSLTGRERKVLAEKPSEVYPKALALWTDITKSQKRLEEQYKTVDSRIDGERIRIPGYALPLEFDGTRVRDFLLVPYVGACIHTPPPPLNQIVFVSAVKSFESKGLFSPVWVEGTISTSGGSHDLSFVDGQAAIEVGYTVDAAKIEPYKW
jgi:hypothetical protein